MCEIVYINNYHRNKKERKKGIIHSYGFFISCLKDRKFNTLQRIEITQIAPTYNTT